MNDVAGATVGCLGVIVSVVINLLWLALTVKIAFWLWYIIF